MTIRKPQVRLPYEGPPLSELWVTSWARLDSGKTLGEGARLSGRSDSQGPSGWPRARSMGV